MTDFLSGKAIILCQRVNLIEDHPSMDLIIKSLVHRQQGCDVDNDMETSATDFGFN